MCPRCRTSVSVYIPDCPNCRYFIWGDDDDEGEPFAQGGVPNGEIFDDDDKANDALEEAIDYDDADWADNFYDDWDDWDEDEDDF